MADNTILVVVIVGVLLVASGVLIVPGINAPADAEFALNLGSNNSENTTTTTTTTTEELDPAQSALSVGTGYVDSEGNIVTPGQVAQSVYWAGTGEEVADLALLPVITIVHSLAVTAIPEVRYRVSAPLIQVRIAGGEEYLKLFTEGVDKIANNIPVDGGQLGITTMLGDIFGIDVSAGVGSQVLEDFLWNAIGDMGVVVADKYVDAGTFTISVMITFQLDNIAVDYSLNGLDGVSDTYETPDDVAFIVQVPLDLVFTVEVPPPDAPSITFGVTTSTPNAIYPLSLGSNTVTVVFKPTTDGTPVSYSWYFNNEQQGYNLAWDGNDISITYTFTVTADVTDYVFKIVVKADNQGTIATKSRSFIFEYIYSSTDGGGGGGGNEPASEPIMDVIGSFSTYLPAGLRTSGTISFLLVGGGILVFLAGAYWAKNRTKTIVQFKRKRKRR